MNSKLLIIIQARTGSTRLKNKILLPFYENKTIVDIIIENLKEYFKETQIVLATSSNKHDNILKDTAIRNSVHFFQGDENNVLKRFIDCANKYKAKTIVRVCADNPFILPEYIIPLIDKLTYNKLDYCSYMWKNGTPVMLSHIGIFCEVMTKDFLKNIYSATNDNKYLEHVTNYLYSNKKMFKYIFEDIPEILENKQEIRLTVDTKLDFENTRQIYSMVMRKNIKLNLINLLNLIKEEPKIISRMEIQIQENAK